MQVFVRLLVGLSVLVLVVILGIAGLAQLKFSSFLADSIGERLEIIAATAARDFGAAIDLGLSLDEVANGPEILARARDHDPTITAIAVFDLEGTVLHSVGDDEGRRVHEDTRAAFRLSRSGINEASWSVESDERIRSGVLINGSFGQPVGAVVVHYPTTELLQQQDSMARQLLFDAVWVSLGLVIMIVLVVWLLRSRIRSLAISTGTAGDGLP